MNVLHISGAGIESGAGKATILTHEALLSFGKINSKILFLNENVDLDENIYSISNISILNKIKRFVYTTLDRIPTVFYTKKKSMIFSSGFFGHDIKKIELFEWADIIHIHWANHGMINISQINKWGKPVVWTLRDMWAFTGGCHYSLECINYKYQCKECQLLGSSSNYDLSTYCFNRKHKILINSNIIWVAISSWMQQVASESLILSKSKISIIFSGIRTDIFIPHSKFEVRQEFGIPLNAKVILIGSANLTDEYKGGKYIIDVLEKCTVEIYVVSFGISNSFAFTNKKIKLLNFGYITDDTKLAKIYSTADTFLAPATNEAFGKTVAEAQSCGVPVLCFAETGPSDIVEHLITGYMAKNKNIEDLMNGFLFCLNHQFDHFYIRNRVVNLFDINITATNYQDIYTSIYKNNIS
jgi:glycosyltransferase involved in cell wall biosynthesis